MKATKITNTLFTYEIIGFDVYIAYDSTSGILRTLSKEEGHVVDERQMRHGMLFDEFSEMAKEMNLSLTEGNGEGNPAFNQFNAFTKN